MWIRGPHPCWKAQKALEDARIPYEVIQHPPRRGKREYIASRTGQRKLPVLEFEDGTMLREDSTAMAARIRAGDLTPPPPDQLLQPPFAG
jgi:glutathione S-transferase